MSKKARRANGEGTVFQRSDGRWTAAYYVSIRGGGRVRRHLYGKTKTEVEGKLAEIRRKDDAGIPVGPSTLTVGQYLDEWLHQVAKPRVRDSTWQGYSNSITHHLVPRLGRKKLNKLAPRDVRQLIAGMEADDLGSRTIHFAHGTLRTALEDAVRDEILDRNIAKLVRAPKLSPKEAKTLTVEQVKQLLISAREHRLYAMFIVFAVLGMRRSEVLGLRWKDVDLKNRVLHIRAGLHRQAGGLVLLEPKTRRSKRTIPLPELVVQALRIHRATQQAEQAELGPNWPDLGYVFTTPVGTPIDPRNCTRMVQNQCKTAGLPAIRLHDLRHGCVSVLLKLKVPPRTVMEIVGHSSLEMTMLVYGHVTLDDQRDALNLFEELLNQEPTSKPLLSEIDVKTKNEPPNSR